MMRADIKVHPYKKSFTLPLSQREREFIVWVPIVPGLAPWAMLMPRRWRWKGNNAFQIRLVGYIALGAHPAT